MIKVTSITNSKDARAFLVDIGDRVTDRVELNRALAERYVALLRDHWREKDQKGNKLGGERTHFWSKAAEETGIASVDEDGATITVGGAAGQQVRIHIFGGTIVPVVAQALTIPIVREAYGLRASEYEEKTGKDLFTFGRGRALFEKVDDGGNQSVVSGPGFKRREGIPWSPGTMIGQHRSIRPSSTVVPLARQQQLRPVYLLLDQVEIPADPKALPSEDETIATLLAAAEDYFEFEGGAP